MTYRPYEGWDYRLDDLLIGEKEPPDNRLLDGDGNPIRRPGDKGVEGLAALAAVLNRYAIEMTPDHLEKAVWWIKDWKRSQSGWYRSISAETDFYKAQERFKASPEYKRDGRNALGYNYGSHLSAALTGVLAVIALFAWLDHSGWMARIGWTIGALFVGLLTAGLRDTARDIWQRQDRRYFLQCLRESRCTIDLLNSGLFSYHPDTTFPPNSGGEEYLRSRRAIRAMHVQLGDALYFDWDCDIRESLDERDRAVRFDFAKRSKAET
jgi:hypothetical protein